jgi:DNA repair protein RecO (recombination protein O)
MGLTKYLGFFPELNKMNLTYFNLEEGKFQAMANSPYCIHGQKLILFNAVLGTKFDELNNHPMHATEKQDLLNMILLYFKLHLQGFKPPKSLSILNQVFN